MSWTPDRKDTLRSMWIEGKSSKQIAEALGDVTRNAVMGMVNRMGLMGNRAHNAHIKAAHGACRPIGVVEDTAPVATPTPAAPEPAPAQPEAAPQASPRHDPVPEPAPRPEPVVAKVAKVAKAANDEPALRDREKRSGLAERLLKPLRRSMATPPPAPAPAAAFISSDDTPAPRVRADLFAAVALVEEVTGQTYDPAATGHRTSLVVISSILGGGDPRRILPRTFPEPFILKTMRSLAEKGIMIAGSTPETWLDPELGDLNFFIDMLVAEGVMKGPRTSSTPIAMTA